jgi:hypothetical protein
MHHSSLLSVFLPFLACLKIWGVRLDRYRTGIKKSLLLSVIADRIVVHDIVCRVLSLLRFTYRTVFLYLLLVWSTFNRAILLLHDQYSLVKASNEKKKVELFSQHRMLSTPP